MVIDKEPFVLESVEPLWNFAGTKGRRASVFCFGDPACKQVRSPIQFPSSPCIYPSALRETSITVQFYS